jgi:ABC-type multidrug transport system ATPase subunit
MLTIKNLNKRYDNGVHAINDISLSIGKGMFGLLGPNGAGKSSFMRTLATLQQPDSGTITFNGIDVLSQPQCLKQVLGYLPQEFGVYPRVSAYELLDYLAVLKGISNKKARKEQVKALLAQTNLYEHKDNNVATFSGGMKRRFGIAQALLGEPKLVMVDEPTAGLDPEERNRFYNLLADVGKDIVLILSTHIIEDIQELCSDMAIIGQGQLLAQATPHQLMASIKNKIWCKMFNDSNELESFEGMLLSTKSVGAEKLAYVYSDVAPDVNFEQVEPSLEDAYFRLLNSKSKHAVAGQRAC